MGKLENVVNQIVIHEIVFYSIDDLMSLNKLFHTLSLILFSLYLFDCSVNKLWRIQTDYLLMVNFYQLDCNKGAGMMKNFYSS
jgi:hypothetical protein